MRWLTAILISIFPVIFVILVDMKILPQGILMSCLYLILMVFATVWVSRFQYRHHLCLILLFPALFSKLSEPNEPTNLGKKVWRRCRRAGFVV